MRLLLVGMKSVDIAKRLGCTEAMVSYTKNSALVQRQLSIMQGARDAEAVDCAIEIKNRVSKALEVLDDTLDLVNLPQLRFKAAEAILDREVPKVSRFEGITARLTGDEIAALKERAIKVAREAGIVMPSERSETVNSERQHIVGQPDKQEPVPLNQSLVLMLPEGSA